MIVYSLVVVLALGVVIYFYYFKNNIGQHERLGVDENEAYKAFGTGHFVHHDTAADGAIAVLTMGSVARVGAPFSIHVFEKSIVLEIHENENMHFLHHDFSIQEKTESGTIRDGVFMGPDGTAIDAWSATKTTTACVIKCTIKGSQMEICLPCTMVSLLESM